MQILPHLDSAVSGIARFFPFLALYPCAGLHLPQCPCICAVVSVAARSLCFRSRYRTLVLPPRTRNRQHSTRRQARAHALAPRARVRACHGVRASAPSFPWLCVPCASVPGIVCRCFRPMRAIARLHRARRQTRATLLCALCRARACACFEVRILRHVVSVAARSLRFRSRHCAPVLPHRSRNRQQVLPRQARVHAPAPRARNRRQALPASPRSCPSAHACNRQQVMPPNSCSCHGAPRAQSPVPLFLALYTVCRLVLAAVSAHLCRRFRGCAFPTLPFPASHAGILAPRAQSPAGAAAKPAFMPRRPPHAVARELVLPQNPRLCVLPFRALRASFHSLCSIHARVCSCRSARAFALVFPGLCVPCAAVPSIVRQRFRPARAIASRRCRQARAHAPAPPLAQSPVGAAAKPAPMPRRPPRAVARELVLPQNPRLCVLSFRALHTSSHYLRSIHAQVCTCCSARTFAPSFPGQCVPCASVPSIARQIFPPRARNRQ